MDSECPKLVNDHDGASLLQENPNSSEICSLAVSKNDSINDMESPSKSKVLSFDAYGNLSFREEPPQDLNDLNYVLEGLESSFRSEAESEVALREKPIKNGSIHKNAKIKSKPKPNKRQVISDEALEKAFKPSITSVPQTRSGRQCKQKSEAGFLFGTFNFNEYKKLTSSSSPKRSKSSQPEVDFQKSPVRTSNSSIYSPATNSTDPDYSSSEEFQTPQISKNKKKIKKSSSNSKLNYRNTHSESESEVVTRSRPRKKRKVQNIDSKTNNIQNGKVSPRDEHKGHSSQDDNPKPLSDASQSDSDCKLSTLRASLRSSKRLNEPLGSLEDDVHIIKNSLKESSSSSLNEDSLSLSGENDSSKANDQILAKNNNNEDCNLSGVERDQNSPDPNSLECSRTKFGRQVKKPDLIDLSLDSKKNKETAVKVKSESLVESSLTVKEKKSLDKEFPCDCVVGDIFWVIMRGSPFWPAVVTYPLDGEQYSKVFTSGLAKQRKYHLTFLNDNQRTHWSSSANLIKFEGETKFDEYLNSLKETPVKFKKGLLWNVVSKTLYLKKRHEGYRYNDWQGAIKQATNYISLSRYERIQFFKKDNESRQKVKKSKQKKSMKRKLKVEKKPENVSDENNSYSDEFLGFDKNSLQECVKKRKLNEKLVGSFDVYMKQHLDSCLKDNPSFTEESANKHLLRKWQKLTPIQKSRYRFHKSPDIPIISIDSDDTSSECSVTVLTCKKKSSSSRGTYRVPRNEKVCFVCGFIVTKDIVKCKGICSGTFHLACVGLNLMPSSDFKCASCLSGIHSCFVCKSNEGKTIKCSVSACGKFYHESCIRKWPQVSKSRQFEKLVCPRHICHMCSANADDMNDPAARTAPFTRCIHCPTTYHTGDTCIAAGVEEITVNYHICTKHLVAPKHNLHYNVNWCFCCSKGGSLLLCDQCPAAFHAECMNISTPEGGYICEDCENGKYPVYGDIVWVKVGNHRWWPAEVLHPKFIPDNIEKLNHQQGMFCVHFFGTNEYFWVSRGRAFLYQEGDQGSKGNRSKVIEQRFKKALEEAVVAYQKRQKIRDEQEESRSLKGNKKPPPYVRIDTNKPVGHVRLGKLDLSSVNRCDCDPFLENPCGSDEKCLNRMLMIECIKEACRAGDRCQNQRFQKRLYPNVTPHKTSATGWGLKTKDFIKKGEFVIEYVGELIDDTELKRRLDEMHECNEQNYYFLTIDKERIIDAGPKGNLARFMNHSCDPNCVTQKWTVGPDTRVGLFALHDIPEDSELNFNYNLECIGTGKKKCNCGTKKCSGFIGAKMQKSEPNGVSKNDKKRKKKKRVKKAKKHEDECFRCNSSGGDLVLCDATMCPKGYHLTCLGLKSLPKGKWLCPWHYCDTCGSKASNKCLLCPNSYCRFHSVGNFHSVNGLGNICLEHEAQDYETLRAQMVVAPAPQDLTVRSPPLKNEAPKTPLEGGEAKAAKKGTDVDNLTSGDTTLTVEAPQPMPKKRKLADKSPHPHSDVTPPPKDAQSGGDVLTPISDNVQSSEKSQSNSTKKSLRSRKSWKLQNEVVSMKENKRASV